MDKTHEVIDKVTEVCDRITKLGLILFNVTISLISAHAPHARHANLHKDCFYEFLQQTTSMTKDNDILFVEEDFNDHV